MTNYIPSKSFSAPFVADQYLSMKQLKRESVEEIPTHSSSTNSEQEVTKTVSPQLLPRRLSNDDKSLSTPTLSRTNTSDRTTVDSTLRNSLHSGAKRGLKIGSALRGIFGQKGTNKNNHTGPNIHRGKNNYQMKANTNAEVVSPDIDAAFRLLSTDRRFTISINNVPEKYRTSTPVMFQLEHTHMQKLVMEMETCLKDLNCSVNIEELEKWAMLIYESMMLPSRTFHSVQHVFDVAIGADSIQKLAAFFHDIIYYSIDGGLKLKGQIELLSDIIIESEGKVYLTTETLDRNTQMVLDIFGFKKGQLLDPYHGLNEVLSSICAVRCYESTIAPIHLANIVACIEATIPFRKKDEQGRDPPTVLFDRLSQVNNHYDLTMTTEELVKAVQRSCGLANRDLKNFSTPERAVFLSNTWNLLPESNIPLRNVIAYRVSDFSLALRKMSGFFSTLDPEVIFTIFRDTDEANRAHRRLTDIAAENIRVALLYMKCKQLAVAVLEAIAVLTGGDAPIALFLGDLPERHHMSPTAENYISYVEPDESLKIDQTVFQLLRYGREEESYFDIKNSPLGAFLYALIGDDGVEKSLKLVTHCMDEEKSMLLLKSIPFYACKEIISACSKIAITRQNKMAKLLQQLEK